MVRKHVWRWVGMLAMGLPVSAAVATAAQVSLVADVGKGQPAAFVGVNTRPSAALPVSGGRAVFAGWVSGSGPGLWVTDGTATGTRLTRGAQLWDRCRNFDRLVPLASNGTLALAWLPCEGVAATDGTAEGTQVLIPAEHRDQYPPLVLPPPPGGRSFDVLMCYAGCTLWRTDGTTAGTRELVTFPSFADDHRMLRTGDKLFVGLRNSLWAWDGARALEIGTIAYSGGLAPVGKKAGRILFSDGEGQLATSDGTLGGTATLTNSPADYPFQGPFYSLGQTTCGLGDDVTHGLEVWCSDGTVAGTRRVSDFGYAYALEGSSGAVGAGRFFFGADPDSTGAELWATTGLPQGTKAVGPCSGGCPTGVANLVALGSRVLFVATHTAVGTEVFASDGTGAGTQLLRDLCPGSGACLLQEYERSPLTVAGKYAFFSLRKGDQAELYRTDGTPAGTVRLLSAKTDAPFVVAARTSSSWLIGALVAGRQRLWTSGGTAALTRLLADLERVRFGSRPRPTAVLGEGVIFTTIPSGGGNESWKVWYSATPGSAVALPMPVTTNHQEPFFSSGGLVYWRSSQSRLARTDGTVAGTVAVVDDPQVSYFGGVTRFGGQTILGVNRWVSSDQRATLYRVSDTANTVEPILELADNEVGCLASTGSDLHFLGDSRRVWRTDLTPAGTSQVGTELFGFLERPCFERHGSVVLFDDGQTLRAIRDGDPAGAKILSGSHRGSLLHRGFAYFWHGVELSRIDLDAFAASGSVGREVIRSFDYDDSQSFGVGRSFVPLPDGRLAFAAFDSETGYELWVSDGTPAGTNRVVDLFPGPRSGLSSDAVAFGIGVAFVADDGAHGTELWTSDGTAGGTKLVKDLWPGAQSSAPENLLPANGRLYFSADDGKLGRELWVARP